MKVAVGNCPSFASLQTYDAMGNTMFCPVYADLDGKDPKKAQDDAQYIVYLIGEMTNLIPDIYYSGNKGYHIIIPHKIEHPQCHLVAKHFFEYLAMDIPTLDKRVYRTQSLLRLPGSPASRPGYFKVQITKQELMGLSHEGIAELGRAPRIGSIDECDLSKLNDEFLEVIEAGKRKIPVYQGQAFSEFLKDLGEEMTPCLAKMIETPPQTGVRNQTVLLLARLFKKCGFTEQATLELLLQRQHFADYEGSERGVSKVLSSLFKSNRPSVIGCKMGNDAALMKSFCDPLCWFNEEHLDLRFKKK